ncbi:MAG: hypothetical protein LBS21_05165 [Clostridiales bacterium]|nr:hypothetical protein [Clostridiales bacterium]
MGYRHFTGITFLQRYLRRRLFINTAKNGLICENISFAEHGSKIKSVVSDELKLINLPILYGLNLGLSSPMFIIPYGAQAEIKCEAKSFSIVEAGVI